MPQEQLNALLAVADQLPEIAKQLRIANKLKAWELKHTPSWQHADEIDEILKED